MDSSLQLLKPENTIVCFGSVIPKVAEKYKVI